MVSRSTWRGHEIVWVGEQWRFADTMESTVDTWTHRPCGFCGQFATPDGHDGCLGTLSGGVVNACCGHGEPQLAYVQFDDGILISGQAAAVALNWTFLSAQFERFKG